MSHAFFSSSVSLLERQAIDLNGPALAPPEGVTPNLVNPHNGNNIAIPIISICVFLTAILYCIRFYATYLGKKLNIADYLSLIAFPIYWVYIYYSYRLSWSPGYMVNMYNVRIIDIPDFTFVCWIATLLYFVVVALVKVAILLEWTSIFATDKKRGFFAISCYATSAVITCLSIILFSMNLANCTPFERNYNPLLPDSFCRFKVPEFGLASAIVNLILDVIPILLAQNVIWGLRLSWRKKLGVSIIFLIGIVGCVTCIVRLYYATKFFSSDDTTYFFSIMGLCSLCETTCAILVLCAPFAPKAFLSVQETKVVSGIKKYISTKTNASYGNNSKAFHELRDIPTYKPETPWENSQSAHAYAEDSHGNLNPSQRAYSAV